jgi:hypothetical protein
MKLCKMNKCLEAKNGKLRVKSRSPGNDVSLIVMDTSGARDILRGSVCIKGIMPVQYNFTGELCNFMSSRKSKSTTTG